jgi:hypothetical protein
MANSNPLFDEEVHNLGMAEWYEVLASLWTAIGKPIERKRLELYGQDLADVPLGLLEIALKRVRALHAYSNIPLVAEIRKAVIVELKSQGYANVEDWIDGKWDLFLTKSNYHAAEILEEK